jgi:hypothetical protein
MTRKVRDLFNFRLHRSLKYIKIKNTYVKIAQNAKKLLNSVEEPELEPQKP